MTFNHAHATPPRCVLKTLGISRSIRHKVAAILILLLCLFGCAHPEPTVVVVVGGLGFSQLGDLRHAVIQRCPDATVINAGAWDGYKSDIKALATAKPHQHYILIGHSFGCEAIDEAAAHLPHVDLAVFIDPAWSDFKLSHNIENYLWFKRSSFGIERQAQIVGAEAPTTIQGSHNDLPHAQNLIDEVVAAIRSTSLNSPTTFAPPPPDLHSQKRSLAAAHE